MSSDKKGNFFKGETSGTKRKAEHSDPKNDSGDKCLPVEDVVSSPSIIVISLDDDEEQGNDCIDDDEEQGNDCIDDAVWDIWIEQYRRGWDEDDSDEEEEEEEGEEGSSPPIENEFDEEVLRHAQDFVNEMEQEGDEKGDEKQQGVGDDGDEDEGEEEDTMTTLRQWRVLRVLFF